MFIYLYIYKFIYINIPSFPEAPSKQSLLILVALNPISILICQLFISFLAVSAETTRYSPENDKYRTDFFTRINYQNSKNIFFIVGSKLLSKFLIHVFERKLNKTCQFLILGFLLQFMINMIAVLSHSTGDWLNVTVQQDWKNRVKTWLHTRFCCHFHWWWNQNLLHLQSFTVLLRSPGM